MRLWDALSSAMGTSRIRRIGSREAEQLLAADPNGSAYPDLSHLLVAAAAPPRPEELVGLRAAVAAFEATGQDGDLSVAVASRRPVFARSVAVKAAAGVAVVLFSGTALAAETGNLPGASQQHAHDLFSALGVPPPDADPTPTGPPTERTTPTPAPSSGNHGATPDATSAATLGLCRSWQARQKNPKNKPMKAESLRVLAAAAGGEEHIAAFCTALLADDDKGKTATDDPSTAPTTPSHPGNGKGHDKTTPTPNPHKKG
jgi:hypothetical protein